MYDIQSLIQRGITLAHQGQKDRAKACFARVVGYDSKNLVAWLWLGRLVEDANQREYCYKKILEIDPDNLEAKEALAPRGRSHRAFPTAAQRRKSAKSYRTKKGVGLGRYKYLIYVAVDVIFILWVYYGWQAGVNSEIFWYVMLSMIGYGFFAYASSGLARSFYKFSRSGTGCLAVAFALILLGAIAPAIHLPYSLFRFFTYHNTLS